MGKIQLTLVISNSLISNNRLSLITAYLEVKILSLPKHENLTRSKKYFRKEEKLLFSSFPQYFQYISNIKSAITYKFVNCGCSNYFFLNSENLICRGTDISKCFRESLGIRDNESWLYFKMSSVKILTEQAVCSLTGFFSSVSFSCSKLFLFRLTGKTGASMIGTGLKNQKQQ